MKDFLKFTFASLLGNLIGLVLTTTLGIGGLIFLVIMVASQDSGPLVKDKSVLVFDLALSVSDTGPNPSTSEALQELLSEDSPTSIQLRTLVQTIDQASKDDKIVALYLQGTNTPISTGLANLKEIRQALQRFKDSGKTIIAYDIDWTAPEYYLASVANQVVINPLGSLDIKGLSSQVMFLTGALEKYGIGVQVIRVGKYKAAVEPFLLKKLSPENREQTQKLLGDLWGEWLRTIAPSRKVTPQQLQAFSNTEGILLADTALKGKLVDRVAYGDEVITDFKKMTGESKEKSQQFRQISINSYSRIPEVADINNGNQNSKNKIAIVYAEGEIVDGSGTSSQIGGDRLAKELRKLRLDEKVKAVVLRVNSPGGSATASEVIGREVDLIRKQKPVIVSMGNFAASGGYWIAMGADQIFAQANTVTGSIGVFGLLFNIQDIASKNGITWDIVKTSKFADIQTNSRPKSPEELARLQKVVNLIYDRFISNVATHRKLPKNQVQEIAQGRVWSGSQAKQLGLVDEIGGLDAAIAAAAKKANLGEDWTLKEPAKPRTLEERILENLAGDNFTKIPTPVDPLTREFIRLQEELLMIKEMNDPKGIYTRLPFNLKIE
ncbi:signal peptide peptidase SppA [Planktothrix agardhii 1029]|uniref:signal peptide peptidase SppA n=1 Tax=Planktothrix agardhii TaxID=1160 RepID=UPI001D0B9559|nr:signal peptide peptidase SppA [Planktothrix agardhii]MCB8776640.1 signal peptide peptidase SppA [Planktothrix agardhii 1031]MCF3591080.1 signal peptide peptidase SppA [Planktothrix agardhii 1029]MCF3599852.1 signal peptide peptidase SppA [Planktothrix agardhii 1032]MCF3619455.1 signal peptide peptidase SppA [Planktothrix agardhii 1030]CAD5944961.1 Protease 4 [Planktothrix agardhii]